MEFPLKTVGGDNMLLIEKPKVDPLGAVLFKAPEIKIYCPKVEHNKVVINKSPVDLLVHECVSPDITGVKEVSAEWVHAEGKVT